MNTPDLTKLKARLETKKARLGETPRTEVPEEVHASLREHAPEYARHVREMWPGMSEGQRKEWRKMAAEMNAYSRTSEAAVRQAFDNSRVALASILRTDVSLDELLGRFDSLARVRARVLALGALTKEEAPVWKTSSLNEARARGIEKVRDHLLREAAAKGLELEFTLTRFGGAELTAEAAAEIGVRVEERLR